MAAEARNTTAGEGPHALDTSGGFVPIYRGWLRSAVWEGSDALLRVFLAVYVGACRKPESVAVKVGRGTRVIHLERGQYLTGRKRLARACKKSESEARSACKTLEKLGILTIESTKQYSVLTVVNYDAYALDGSENRQPIRQPVDQPMRPPSSQAKRHIQETEKRKNNNNGLVAVGKLAEAIKKHGCAPDAVPVVLAEIERAGMSERDYRDLIAAKPKWARFAWVRRQIKAMAEGDQGVRAEIDAQARRREAAAARRREQAETAAKAEQDAEAHRAAAARTGERRRKAKQSRKVKEQDERQACIDELRGMTADEITAMFRQYDSKSGVLSREFAGADPFGDTERDAEYLEALIRLLRYRHTSGVDRG